MHQTLTITLTISISVRSVCERRLRNELLYNLLALRPFSFFNIRQRAERSRSRIHLFVLLSLGICASFDLLTTTNHQPPTKHIVLHLPQRY